jgi:hypothetical protein
VTISSLPSRLISADRHRPGICAHAVFWCAWGSRRYRCWQHADVASVEFATARSSLPSPLKFADRHGAGSRPRAVVVLLSKKARRAVQARLSDVAGVRVTDRAMPSPSKSPSLRSWALGAYAGLRSLSRLNPPLPSCGQAQSRCCRR